MRFLLALKGDLDRLQRVSGLIDHYPFLLLFSIKQPEQFVRFPSKSQAIRGQSGFPASHIFIEFGQLISI